MFESNHFKFLVFQDFRPGMDPLGAVCGGGGGGANFPIKYLNIKQLSLNNNKYN